MRSTWWLLFALGCTASDEVVDDDSDVGDSDSDVVDTDTTLDPATFITITTPTTAPMECLPEPGTWLTQTVDPSCITTVPVEGTVEDFETQDPVADVTIELFFDDTVSGDPDVTMTSTAEGVVAGGSAPTCTVWASRATNPLDPESRPAIQMHWSEPFASPMDAYFNSVAGGTISLMSALLGIDLDSTRGVVAGTVYGCDGRSADNVQMIVRAADGTYPAAQQVRYFVDDFPTRNATQTSEDGLYLVGGLVPGDYVVEAWAVPADGEDARVIAQTEVEVFADSLTIGEIYTGSGDGKVLDEACLSPCSIN